MLSNILNTIRKNNKQRFSQTIVPELDMNSDNITLGEKIADLLLYILLVVFSLLYVLNIDGFVPGTYKLKTPIMVIGSTFLVISFVNTVTKIIDFTF